MAFSPAQKQQWRKENRDHISAYGKAWRTAHRDHLRQYGNGYYAASRVGELDAFKAAWAAKSSAELNELMQIRDLAKKVALAAYEYMLELGGYEQRQNVGHYIIAQRRLLQWQKESQAIRAEREAVRAVALAAIVPRTTPEPLTLEEKRERRKQYWITRMMVPGARELKRERDNQRAKLHPRVRTTCAPLTTEQREARRRAERNRRAQWTTEQRDEHNRRRTATRKSRATGAPRGRPRLHKKPRA